MDSGAVADDVTESQKCLAKLEGIELLHVKRTLNPESWEWLASSA